MRGMRALQATIVVTTGLVAVVALSPSALATFLIGALVALALVALHRSADDPPAPETIPVRVDEHRRRRR